MKLYYLTNEKWAKVILQERRLKLSSVKELNDPFELLGASIGNKGARVIAKYVQKRLSETFGLVCMSTTWQSPVMWAHYGDKHKGICLGFEVHDAAPKEVQYTPMRLTGLLGESPKLSTINNDVLEAIMTTKFSDWSYEKEWRLIVNFKNAEHASNGNHFISFNSPLISLREVILGHRCEWQLSEAERAIGKVSHGVTLKRVRPSFQKFEMVRQLREAALHIKPTLL